MKFIKYLFLALTFTICVLTLNAQNAPAGINYQAVLRDQEGQIIADQQIKVKVSVNDPEVRSSFYTEIHTVTTNNVGIFSLVIGGGKALQGAFKEIPWSTANTWLEVAYDTDNNGIYEITGTTRMLSVPYAFYAEKAGSAANGTGANPNGADGGDIVGQEAWMLKGNDDVDDNLMWLGTRNYADLVVKTHGTERIRITKGVAADLHDGQIIILEDVVAEKSMTIGEDLEVRGHTLLDDELMVIGNTYLNANLDVAGNATVDKVLYVKGNVNADGDVVFNNDLTVLDDASVWGDAKVDGNMYVHHSLFVDIDGDFGHNLHVGNDADIDHNLNVDNDGHIGRDLDIDHNLNVDNDGHIGRDLDVDRNVNIDNNLTVQNDAFIKGDLDVDGTGTFFDLHVERDADIDRDLNVDVNAHIGQDLDVDRDVNIDRNLTVDFDGNFGQDVDINRNLNVDNNASVGGTLDVDGTLNANCRLVVNSCVSGSDDNSANYPVHIKGGNQGVYIEVTGGRSTANNFATFADASQIWGRVEGQTLDELHTSFEYIWTHSMNALTVTLNTASAIAAGLSVPPDVAEVAVAGAEAVQAAAEWLEWGINADLKIGVAYESGSGDYAEWLERANPAQDLNYGEIVGVRGGKISHNTEGTDHVMVVSFAPIVLGNMPDPARAQDFEKVAFMGQVPVRVMGKVAVGDYILPSGFNDGFGKAVNPAKMRTEDYARIVGVAWQAGESFPMNIVNVAVGINTNDLASRVSQQQREMDVMKLQMNQLFALLGQKSPYEGLENVASLPAPVASAVVATPIGFSKAETNQIFENNRAMIEEVFNKTRADLEKQGANLNKFPEIAALYQDPVKWIKEQNEKGYLDEMLLKANMPSKN